MDLLVGVAGMGVMMRGEVEREGGGKNIRFASLTMLVEGTAPTTTATTATAATPTPTITRAFDCIKLEKDKGKGKKRMGTFPLGIISNSGRFIG